MPTLDIFADDAFTVRSLTDAINKIPFVPGRAGIVADWRENGITTTTIWIESKSGVITLVDPSARGGPGASTAKRGREGRPLPIPHYQLDDAVYADEVQNVRAFGQETAVQMVMARVNERQTELSQLRLDPTLEYQRLGALRGMILNADGSVLLDLYDAFGEEPQDEVDFNLDAATDNGDIRKTCAQVARMTARSLGGSTFRSIHAFCGDNFYDALVKAKETRATFLNQQEATQLRGPSAFMTFQFGEITFENYRGGTGIEEAEPFIEPDKCHIFPLGVPGLYRTVNAPADYIETVNTTGLPRYTKQYRMPNDKGITLEVQANSLSYCTRPRVLIKGKLT